MSILVFGHTNPDTDSITSAISLTYLKKQLGMDVKACALGEVRKEAKFVLDKFNLDYPTIIESVKDTDKVMLVDHNEFGQSVEGLKDAEILEIVDHHKLGGITTSYPVNFRNVTVGSTCTIVYNMFKENNIEIPYEIAGALISGITSDTLLFRSPTTTEVDKKAVEELNKILNLDLENYAMEMFKAGTSLDGYTIEEIVNMDFKAFDMEGLNVAIGQVFTLDIDAVFNKKEEFLNYLNSTSYDGCILVITDILKEGSYILYKCTNEIISKAFDVDAYQGVFVDGVVSRKKQVVPNLIDAIKATK